MNFSMHQELYVKKNRTIITFLLLNLFFFIGVVIFEMKNWSNRLILTACFIIGGIIIRHFWGKIFKAKKIRLSEVEAIYSKEPIICYAENYFGLVRKQKYGYLILMTIYVAVLLYACLALYSVWISSIVILIVLSIIHILLVIPVMIILLRMMETSVFFTNNTLFLSHSTGIEIKKINKYQFIECIKGGAILELNTGVHFVRLFLDKEEFHIVKDLLTHS